MFSTATLPLARQHVTAVLVAIVLAIAACAAIWLLSAERISAQEPTPPEIVAQTTPPTLAAVARADGVHLTWTVDTGETTPRGWSLAGFTVRRWVAGQKDGTVVNMPDMKPHRRSYIDRLRGTSDLQRSPGFTFVYAINSYYHRVGDFVEQTTKLNEIEFTTPSVPAPRGLRAYVEESATPFNNTPIFPTDFHWAHPHLPWDSSDFGHVTAYEIFSGDERIATRAYKAVYQTSYYDHVTYDRCPERYKIRAVYGVFYSDFSVANQVSSCGG